MNMLILMVLLMNKAPLSISSSIRTNSSDVLLRNVSIKRMHNSLIDLFVDRTNLDTISGIGDEDSIKQMMQFNKCNSMNDERTIKFHQSWKQASDVFDEKLQIWIDKSIDTEKDNLFIPRDDAQ